MVLVAGTVVVAAPAGAVPTVVPTKVYKACADKDSGAIRLVVKGKKCKKNERKLEWNVQGPAGMTGPVGPQGPQGPQGEPGFGGVLTMTYGISGFVPVGPFTEPPEFYTNVVRLFVGGNQKGLAGPQVVGPVSYRPTSLAYCIDYVSPGSAIVADVVRHISPDGATASAGDDTSHSAAGCYTVALPTTSISDLGFEMHFVLTGPVGGYVDLNSAAATWSPSTT